MPEKIEKSNWKALFVFGDKTEPQVTTYPATASAFLLDYPEKRIVEDKSAKRVARKPDMAPLIEHVVIGSDCGSLRAYTGDGVSRPPPAWICVVRPPC